jgi:hypothetical protein
MGRGRNNIVAVTGMQARGCLQDLFSAAMGNTRGVRRPGDLAPVERIRELGFDAPGLEREAENLADTINRQTAEQRGRPNILVGVPDFTAQDVAPFASILLKNRAAGAALSKPQSTLDTSRMLTSLVNLIVNSGTQRTWDLTSNSSFDLKNLLWWHTETVASVGEEDNPAFDVSAETNAIQVLYERLCEHFRVPDESRSQNLCRA